MPTDDEVAFHFLEEAILVAGYLNGAGMDPVTSLFSMLGQLPGVKGSSVVWITTATPTEVFVIYIVFAFVFGRLIGLSALTIAYASGLFFHTALFHSELVLVFAMILGLFAGNRHISNSSDPWWL